MNKILFFLICNVAFNVTLHSQSTMDSVVIEANATTVYENADVMPVFKGGDEAMYKFLAKNLNYPAIARDNGIEGKVYVKFIVDENGIVRDPVIVSGIGGGCDEESIRVISLMPPWKPGMINGERVAVYYTLPITFKLN